MTHELNMIDYIDWIKDEGMCFKDENFVTTFEDALKYKKILEHRDLLKSPPKLGDFVPTNEKREVMDRHIGGMREGIDDVKHKEYRMALDRVLWKGWEIVEGETKYHLKKPNEGSKSLLAYVDKTKPKAFELLNEILGNKTYDELITSGVKLERIQRK